MTRPILHLLGHVFLLFPLPFLRGAACNCFERNMACSNGLRFGQRNQAALKQYIPPLQLEPFACPHPIWIEIEKAAIRESLCMIENTIALRSDHGQPSEHIEHR